MLKRKPPKLAEKTEWRVFEQLMLPRTYREDILKVVHKVLLVGHLGVTKMHKKLTKHFYWPGIMGDVKRFCRACKICRETGSSNQKIP